MEIWKFNCKNREAWEGRNDDEEGQHGKKLSNLDFMSARDKFQILPTHSHTIIRMLFRRQKQQPPKYPKSKLFLYSCFSCVASSSSSRQTSANLNIHQCCGKSDKAKRRKGGNKNTVTKRSYYTRIVNGLKPHWYVNMKEATMTGCLLGINKNARERRKKGMSKRIIMKITE